MVNDVLDVHTVSLMVQDFLKIAFYAERNKSTDESDQMVFKTWSHHYILLGNKMAKIQCAQVQSSTHWSPKL